MAPWMTSKLRPGRKERSSISATDVLLYCYIGTRGWVFFFKYSKGLYCTADSD